MSGEVGYSSAWRDQSGKAKPSVWLGVLVLAGVLTTMLLIGAIFSALRQSIASVLPVLLPIIYGLVIVLGILMLLGLNPFARLAASQSPVLRDPRATAFLYGALLAPMTLPCIGPLIIATFAIGAGSADTLAQGLLYFLAFGLGFGWPLVLLPLLTHWPHIVEHAEIDRVLDEESVVRGELLPL